MRVATYSRVSTSNHDQNPDVQVQELKRYCEARGWVVVKEIVDHGFSGGSDKRPGLQELFKLVDSKEIDCVCVVKLDRLFRSLKQLVTVLDDFQSKNVSFVAVRDSVDYTSPAGKMFTQILGSLAEFEKALVRERTIAGLQYAKNVKGKKLGKPKKTYNIELMKHLQAQGMSVRKIAKLVGTSHSTVARELNVTKKVDA
ncbi:MAG: recombinase family protein [Bdellovibrionota bacterium]